MMQYFGTNFCLTLGAMRLRFSFALEDAPDDSSPGPSVSGTRSAAEANARAQFDRVHTN